MRDFDELWDIWVDQYFLWVFPIILLAIAILPLPYWCYFFIRLFVCLPAIGYCFIYRDEKNWIATILFGAIAVLYNPIVPVHLFKELWVLINITTAVVFLYYGHKAMRDSQDSTNNP